MALYEKEVQLLDARLDLKGGVVPRLGELHTVMARLRALGTSIENSGIDDAWIEADVYGYATPDRSSSAPTTREPFGHTSILTWLYMNLPCNNSSQRSPNLNSFA
ncbi:hypothetical protein DPMN_038237 [Dreissena polymorpha]|uniref:Uncharacterized protein n=1 Tax=Dreissena polymorpha TaxID=45954 RepID=A0A9D4RNG7_DREPO|nr:hypothetical protein DPMN_038237 [Dreissena polymorpha]